MKLKKENHNHKEQNLNDAENQIHKHTKSAPHVSVPSRLSARPGGYFGRKWFNHTPVKGESN